MSDPSSPTPPQPLPSPGWVSFVGAGPGAVDLITLRALHRLAQATVVLHDALTDPALRGQGPQARWIDVGKRGFGDAMPQAEICALLVAHASAGERVVRLKGGDPSLFGRLEEEAQALDTAGIGWDVVPGVTAALAAAADSRRPLSRRGRGRSVTIATAMSERRELLAGPGRGDTEVFYMAGRQLPALARRLVEAGWSPQASASVVSRAGWPDVHCSHHTLATLHEAAGPHAGRPTIVTLGVGADPIGPGRPADPRCGASGGQPVDPELKS